MDLELSTGSLCALLGPNGAGKSTTLGMLTGSISPTSGRIHLLGLELFSHLPALKSRMGVVPESLGLFDHLTVEEHLHLSGPLYGLSLGETRDRAESLLQALDLLEARHRFASQCSHGMRKKTALALALLHDPDLLFLDEPFEGLDPAFSKALQGLLRALCQRGRTIFFTSHSLALVEPIATRTLLLHEGRLIERDPASMSVEAHYFAH
ncbi:MAG: ABC transporter ATP-binding protein, partial [Firmicutes bacterium]|nr:ABC transporter ATP-binding protein [Bacillota bacterium]